MTATRPTGDMELDREEKRMQEEILPLLRDEADVLADEIWALADDFDFVADVIAHRFSHNDDDPYWGDLTVLRTRLVLHRLVHKIRIQFPERDKGL